MNRQQQGVIDTLRTESLHHFAFGSPVRPDANVGDDQFGMSTSDENPSIPATTITDTHGDGGVNVYLCGIALD
jgi:hypothetical protein